MDINDFRGILTAITLFAFVGIWVFAWSGRRKADYDEAASMPLEEDKHLDTNKQESI